jgi:hypothetical protein
MTITKLSHGQELIRIEGVRYAALISGFFNSWDMILGSWDGQFFHPSYRRASRKCYLTRDLALAGAARNMKAREKKGSVLS